MSFPAPGSNGRLSPAARHRGRASLLGGVLAILGAATALAESASATNGSDWSLGGATPSSTGSVDAPVVTGARIVRNDELTRFVLDVSSPVTPRAFVMVNPNRVIIDMPETIFRLDPAIGQPRTPARPAGGRAASSARKPAGAVVPEGAIASFRFGRLAAGKSRIVIDLGEPALIVRTASESDEAGGARLILELARSEATAFAAAAKESIASLPVQKPARVEVVDPANSPIETGGQPVVVIDPGHGGIDTGAQRSNGVAVEKDLVLEFSRTLAQRLRRTARYKVVMTRDEDIFVPLGERVQIAQTAQAQLLVSIHADTLRSAGVSGATVYTVSEKASDRDAARLAEQENLADKVAGLDSGEETGDVSDILFDLTRRETRAYSHLFARTLVSIWKDAGNLNKNPMRSAGFRVLKAPDVPSVLLELGYLSSEKDAAQMLTPEWREKTAEAVTRSIDSFFAPRIKARSAAETQEKQDGKAAGVAATLQ